MVCVLADTWYLFQKYFRITLRMPMWALFTVVQPLIWLLIFGQLFKSMSSLPGFPPGRYMDFFLPGAVIMTVLFGSSWAGVSLLREINFGTVDKMLVTPVSRIAIVFSRVLHSSATVVLQCAIIVIVAMIFGAPIALNLGTLIFSVLVILFLASGFAAISNGLAILLKREEPLVVLGNMMTLPLMFFSSGMVPKVFMPDWIRAIASVNPIDYAVETMRFLFVGQYSLGSLSLGLGFLFLFAVVTIVWSTEMFMNQGE
jgi:ABC-2 type transport system permease protein